ncbi:MAG: Modification methylase PvuII [Actinobacteria bacterium ADurb.Bin346]|nr:MAG: Modification methylase PvuII [Actinobacteria bacterium ADurb.Bin346]
MEKKETLPYNSIICGDCLEVLSTLPENSVDLIVTSPPYADSRKNVYGGVAPKSYPEWFYPRSKEFLNDFCTRGKIDWHKLVRFNSGHNK